MSAAYDPSQLQQPQQPSVTNSSASTYPSNSLTNLSPGIIITLLILSVTIILTTSLCLLFRHFHRLPNFLSRHSHRRHSSDSSSDSSSRRLSHRPPATPTPATVNQSLIDSLPLFSFSSVTRRNNTAAATTTSSSAVIDADCAVCLSRFVSHDSLRLLPLCCHAFHSRCIDTWLSSGHDTCPLCRSNVYTSPAVPAESILRPPGSSVSPNGSFRLEIGSVSRHRSDSASDSRRSYSIGSFDYVVDTDSEVAVADQRHSSLSDKDDSIDNNTTEIAELNPDSSIMISGATTGVGGSRSWLGEYMDRLSATLSSRTASFRSSRRFFTGSSRRSEVAGVGEWDIEVSRVGEEISELFRWASGV